MAWGSSGIFGTGTGERSLAGNWVFVKRQTEECFETESYEVEKNGAEAGVPERKLGHSA